ncbi:MAG: pyrrolo-quinoline quinone [Acidobacteriia bacterium]|nr:pyrrolo-quinoline quinone [Terriglobia bacterium]
MVPLRSLLLLALTCPPAAALQPVLTSQYDSSRTGATLGETALTPGNVNPQHFGKRFVFHVDGAVFAQPLYFPGVTVPGKGTHHLVFVATEHDSVYAFDAEGLTAEPLWHVSFLKPDAGIHPVIAGECPFITPELGITSTPVIDEKTGTLYVLARTKEHRGLLQDVYVQKLHALALTTGVEKFGGPVEIRASVPGRGAGGEKGVVAFDPLRENPRAALLLANDRVYLSWASSCDIGPYHGWVMAYDTRTLQQLAAFNTSPDAEESGIWMSDTGPAAASDGSVFVVTGNGRFTAGAGGRDWGDSVLKLRLDRGRLAVSDSFTPHDQRELNAHDADLGSGGPVLLPGQHGPHPRLLLAGGKGASLYLIDRDRMGGYQPRVEADAVQTIIFPGGLFGAPAYWNGHVYAIAGRDRLREFTLESGALIPGRAASLPQFSDGGATPAISANTTKDAIVWAVQTRNWREGQVPAVLRAYDALDVRRELYTSEQNAPRDRAGAAVRFTIPTVANGRVYVGARGEVDVYGLLPTP